MLENTEGLIQKDNPEKQATYDTQDTGQIHVGEYRRGNKKGQSRETGNIGCTRSRQTKQNHNTMCWTLLFASRHTLRRQDMRPTTNNWRQRRTELRFIFC